MVSLCIVSCKEKQSHNSYKELNLGYRFNPSLYEIEKARTCKAPHDLTILQESPHRFFCSQCGYVPYNDLDYKGKTLSEVMKNEGNTQMEYKDTLYYGYRTNRLGEPVFGIPFFYKNDGELDMSQEFYRVSAILNKSTCYIKYAMWKDTIRTLTLYFLEDKSDTTAFFGFQSSFDYPQYLNDVDNCGQIMDW